MKFLLVLALLSLPLVANAEVKRPGTFVPSLCSRSVDAGYSTSVVAVDSVCVGYIVAGADTALQVMINDGTDRVYEVEYANNLGGMGRSKSNFEGVNTKDDNETISGTLYRTHGMTMTHDIVLETSSNLEFSGSLDYVSVTE